MSTPDLSTASRTHPKSEEDQRSAGNRSFDVDAKETNGSWEDPVVTVRGSCKPEWKRSLEPSETNGIGGHP